MNTPLKSPSSNYWPQVMLERKEFSLACALPENTVIIDNVRIEFITSRLVRFEYSAVKKFEDRQTLAVINRQIEPVKFELKQNSTGHVLTTSHIKITLKDAAKPLSHENLTVEFTLNNQRCHCHCDDIDPENLGGTIRTLDCCDGGNHVTPDRYGHPIVAKHRPIDLGKGFISRQGFSVIDDSKNILIDNIGQRKWVTPRDQAVMTQDFYFLVYGHEYKQALSDAAMVFGSQPLAPRYTLGYWWSRFWPYSDSEIEQLVTSFDTMNVPIDVMVIDMDWHLPGWTGYTWDKRYFPDPEEHLNWLHQHGCKVTLNLHPADGVAKHESQFNAMADAMNVDKNTAERVEFNITDPKYIKHYFEILHHPLEKGGVDFWWMDWQQGESTQMKGLDTLPWINHLHWEDLQERANNKRPLIFSRYGGIGAGRYNIGFSGDTFSSWDSLAYQTFFTATASNVLYGYWSHDIGGHLHGEVDSQLYMRWVQYGAFSPILRTHTTRNARAERRFWEYPAPYNSIMMQTVRDRYELVPYIYTENFHALLSGLSLCRPLYYEDADDERSYEYSHQYYFGSAMLLNPVVKPCSPESMLSEVETFLPPGEWFDVARGKMESGDQVITRNYLLSEIPRFVRPGTVIPGQLGANRLNDAYYSSLIMTIYPGEKGQYDLYEDDGISNDYEYGKHVIIAMEHHNVNNVKKVKIFKRSGECPTYNPERSLVVRVVNIAPPQAVSVDGKKLSYAYRYNSNSQCWSYDGINCSCIIKLDHINLDEGVEIDIQLSAANGNELVDGASGLFRRLELINNLAIPLECEQINPRLTQELYHSSVDISRNPALFQEKMSKIRPALSRIAAFDQLPTEPDLDKYPIETWHRNVQLQKRLKALIEEAETL